MVSYKDSELSWENYNGCLLGNDYYEAVIRDIAKAVILSIFAYTDTTETIIIRMERKSIDFAGEIIAPGVKRIRKNAFLFPPGAAVIENEDE